MYRYRFHFGVFLSSPVLEDDVEEIKDNLLTAWSDAQPSLSGLNIVFGLQEEMLTESG